MSQLYVDNIRNRTGGPIGIPTGAVVTGVITATTGNFTGNMTVGGVLTYEDVTNIDSTGIITAKSGIKVTGGRNFSWFCFLCRSSRCSYSSKCVC